MKNKIYIFPVIFLVLILFSGCEKPPWAKEPGENPGNKESVENTETVFAVNTTKAVRGRLLNYLEINGDVVSESKVDVYAEVMGKLVTLNVGIGDRVQQGTVIGEVDPSKPGMNYAKSPVKSPIKGTITSLPVYVGSTISPSIPVATVSKMDDLRIETFIAERFISKMKVGLDAIVHFEAFPDTQFTAKVSELAPVVDPMTRTMEIKLDFTGRYDRVKAGMFADIKIITEKKNNIVKIPAECLVKRYGGNFVFVIKDNDQVEMRAVNTGINIDNKLEITQGLEPDEEVVIRGQTLLEDNAKVKIIDQIAPLDTDDTIY
jgi:membrane fusion protein, multidrug efflux system